MLSPSPEPSLLKPYQGILAVRGLCEFDCQVCMILDIKLKLPNTVLPRPPSGRESTGPEPTPESAPRQRSREILELELMPISYGSPCNTVPPAMLSSLSLRGGAERAKLEFNVGCTASGSCPDGCVGSPTENVQHGGTILLREVCQKRAMLGSIYIPQASHVMPTTSRLCEHDRAPCLSSLMEELLALLLKQLLTPHSSLAQSLWQSEVRVFLPGAFGEQLQTCD